MFLGSAQSVHLEFKVAEFEWSVALWFDEPIRFRIRQRDDGQRHRNVRQIGAAIRGVVLYVDVQEIIIGNMSRMRCRCHLSEHENLLWCPRLRLAPKHLLSFERSAVVSNNAKIKLHLLYNLSSVGFDTAAVFILNEIPLKASTWQINSLDYLEFNLTNSQMLLRIVDSYHGVCDFIRIEDILVKVHSQISRSILATAATVGNAAITTAACKLRRMLKRGICHKRYRWLMNDKHLLILQILPRVRQDSCLHTILHICLWSVVMIFSGPHY